MALRRILSQPPLDDFKKDFKWIFFFNQISLLKDPSCYDLVNGPRSEGRKILKPEEREDC